MRRGANISLSELFPNLRDVSISLQPIMYFIKGGTAVLICNISGLPDDTPSLKVCKLLLICEPGVQSDRWMCSRSVNIWILFFFY